MTTICYIIPSLGKGGAERQLFELVKGINRNKFLPVVISLSEGGHWKKEIQSLGVEVIELKRKKNKEFSRLFRLVKILRTINADIVHTYMFSANTYGRIAAISSGISTIIASERNIGMIGMDKKKYHIFLDKLLSYFSKKIICNSYYCSSSLVNNQSIRKNKVITIHNGIDITRYNINSSKTNSNKKVIGTVGRLEHQKNHKLFLQIAKSTLDKYDNHKPEFIIIGDGELYSELNEYSKELGIEDNIKFYGERHDLNILYKNMDVFVLTSFFEGLPNVIMEAMASGLPVVATDAGGTSELVKNNITGFLCPSGNADILADKVDYLLQNEQEAIKMGKKGRERIKTDFSIDKMVSSTEKVYSDILTK